MTVFVIYLLVVCLASYYHPVQIFLVIIVIPLRMDCGKMINTRREGVHKAELSNNMCAYNWYDVTETLIAAPPTPLYHCL
jgi:uncharacterized membrane protein